MPSWIDLVASYKAQPDKDKADWLDRELAASLKRVSAEREGRNVIFYASAFLQKPQANQLHIQLEDINGFMSVMHELDWDKGLTLLIHTPGGVTSATETIVDYIRSKFSYVEVIVPTIAMSAGTMISLSANKIIMGRQSQLGPIDPQMPLDGGSVSATAILNQFEMAKKEISSNPKVVHAWAPALSRLGPALVQDATNAVNYSELIVSGWIQKFVLAGDPQAKVKADKIAKHFNRGSNKKNHGRRSDREEARQQGVEIEDLEDSQQLQDAVLSAYHIVTILFQTSNAVRLLINHDGKRWFRSA